MKKLFTTLLLGVALSCGAASYTEFYVQTTADNLNAGSTTSDAATHTYAGGTFVRATGVFTVAAGDPSADGVVAGNWVSIYTTAGATVATCVALVTNVTITTITIDLGAIAGAVASVSEVANAATAKVGGAWKGPNAAVGFPFNFATAVLTNTSGNVPRVNIKSNALYSVTAAMTHSLAGPIVWQGYGSTVGDGVKANIDGGATGASFIVLTASGADNEFVDLIFSHNGNSGTSVLLVSSGARNNWNRVVVHDAIRSGMSVTQPAFLTECEFYNCNLSGGASQFGVGGSGISHFTRCISHDNTGSATTDGFSTSASMCVFTGCIADSNGRNGFVTSSVQTAFQECDAYNNASNGIDVTSAAVSVLTIENSNFVKNGANGIASTGASLRHGRIVNCGFGTGTQTNVNGSISSAITAGVQGGIVESGSVLYTVDQTPWADPGNGDFRITLTAAKSAGRGAFTQTAGSYAGTIGYPDIGAAQSSSTNAAASGGSYTFAQ